MSPILIYLTLYSVLETSSKPSTPCLTKRVLYIGVMVDHHYNMDFGNLFPPGLGFKNHFKYLTSL